MEKAKEILLYLLLLLPMVMVCSNYYRHLKASVKADKETRQLVEEWLKEGPPSTIVGKMRAYLPWWKMADPLQECGVEPEVDPADLGWLEYLVMLEGAKERLKCLQHHIKEAKQEHLEFTKMFCRVVMMVIGVFYLVCMKWAIKVYLDNIFRIKICSATPLPGWSLSEEDLPEDEHHQEEPYKHCVTQQEDAKKDPLMLAPTKRKRPIDSWKMIFSHPLAVLSDELVPGSQGVHSGTTVLCTRPDQAVFRPGFETPTCGVVPDCQTVFLLRREVYLRCSSSTLIFNVPIGFQSPNSTVSVMQQDAVNDMLSPVLSLPSTERGRGIQSLFNQSVTREQVWALLRFTGNVIISYIIEGTHPRYW